MSGPVPVRTRPKTGKDSTINFEGVLSFMLSIKIVLPFWQSLKLSIVLLLPSVVG